MCELQKRSGDFFFYLRGSGEILQKLPVIDAKQQFQFLRKCIPLWDLIKNPARYRQKSEVLKKGCLIP